MSDTYDAIYNAVRSRISSCDVGEAIRSACHFDASHAIAIIQQDFCIAAGEMQRPSVLYRPGMTVDGNQWCALYGTNLHDGVAGFGDSPAAAMTAFDVAWIRSLTAREAKSEMEVIDNALSEGFKTMMNQRELEVVQEIADHRLGAITERDALAIDLAQTTNEWSRSVTALKARISELEAGWDKKKNESMQAIAEVLQEETKSDSTIGARGLANWMGIAERIYDALNPKSEVGASTPEARDKCVKCGALMPLLDNWLMPACPTCTAMAAGMREK